MSNTYETALDSYVEALEKALAEAKGLQANKNNKAAGARLRKQSLQLGKAGGPLRKLSVAFYKK